MTPTAAKQRLEQLCINTVRTLSMDAVQKANSGHPGTPMALAPLAFVIWDRFLRFNPRNPQWAGRDRFVLSNGHASMLLYSMLYLTGFDLTLDDLKSFRQWGSKTPGHPEYGLTAGVETTTGPLGQGCGNSVGMAIAQRWLASRFNKDGHDVFDYRIYTICGDGDLMEGVSNEAASIAGHLGLSNLIWFYDNNHITIEGNTSLAFSDDVGTRFLGWHWNVQHVSDANDLPALDRAIHTAQKETERPSLIIVNSHIGYGAPHKQDTAEAHGEALGPDEVRLTKLFYGWPPDAQFLVPEDVKAYMGEAVGRGAQWEQEWNAKYAAWAKAFPDLATEWELMAKRELPQGWDRDIPTFAADAKGMATRESDNKVLNAVAKNIPWLIGGAADLAPSTKTLIKDAGSFERGEYDGRNFHFGIREHAMGAIVNGMSLSLIRPYGSTFFIFTDYMRPAIRLAALMDLPAIFIYTHDSIGLGEDGPTHQPIEHLMSLRAMPRLMVFRPGDANEVSETWRYIMPLKHEPVLVVLTRQALPTLDRTKYAAATGVAKGAYVLADSGGTPEVILMGTGSEVQLCVGAYEKLVAEGVKARVVSMPCWELFEKQSAEYRAEVLPAGVRARVAVEAGATLGWSRYVGADGEVVGRDDFGASAPIKDLMTHFGFTIDNVVAKAHLSIGKAKS
ncbi:MAG TPA: transketolase [Candidatus Eisenbacteria bacterium]|nr:transketolase [Candidatus Eisenbacteria bacterium]